MKTNARNNKPAVADKQAGLFDRFSSSVTKAAGSTGAFFSAAGLVLIWALTGPVFHYSETWQLVINTGTTVVTFLMVFLIQNTQNRDAEAVQVKLDELLRATSGAHNALLDLEELEQRELDQIRSGYARLAEGARANLRRGECDTGVPDVA